MAFFIAKQNLFCYYLSIEKTIKGLFMSTQEYIIPSFKTVPQLSLEEVEQLSNSDWWKSATAEDIAIFQVFQERLVCPFLIFQQSIEKTVGELLSTIAFSNGEGVQAMILDKFNHLTIEEIVDKKPKID